MCICANPGTKRQKLLRVGHEPRHGTAYVSSWIKALENDPREIRAAAVDAQRISDWLIARERERKKDAERTEHEPSRGEAGRTRQPIEPDRSEATLVGERSRGQTVHGGPEQEVATPAARVPDPAVRGHSYDSGPTR